MPNGYLVKRPVYACKHWLRGLYGCVEKQGFQQKNSEIGRFDTADILQSVLFAN